jgi:hypothetical protein
VGQFGKVACPLYSGGNSLFLLDFSGVHQGISGQAVSRGQRHGVRDEGNVERDAALAPLGR